MRLTKSGYTPDDPPPVTAPAAAAHVAEHWRVIAVEFRKHHPVATVRGSGLCVACASAWPCPSWSTFDWVLSWLADRSRAEK